MQTTCSPWEDVQPVSSVLAVPSLTERTDARLLIGSSTSLPEPFTDADHASQDAIEGRCAKRTINNRRPIGIMFGIDPKNLYEAPANTRSRDRTVRDLD